MGLEIGSVVLAPIYVLCGLGVVVAIRGIGETVREDTAMRKDAAALVSGELMPQEKNKRMRRDKKHAGGLRFKLVLFTISLVTVVTVVASLPLYTLKELDSEQKAIFEVITFLAAQIIGVIGAILLSNLMVKPIKQLVRHVESIRDTNNLARLSGVEIKIKSRDELAILGDTINDMTDGLVKAALASSELSIGKEFQKKFLPLELDRFGNQLSTGYEETRYFSLFGYYEGAKEVSGDYFDYLDLDGRYYAIIKCDVAGKGVPAAFIMIQVATMFLNYFKHWEPNEEGMHIENMGYQINEFIETLAFKDRFAAFTLCLYDSHTGTARFCNAGDNIVHFYDASGKSLKTLTLPETPAAGALSNFMVESKGGYKVQAVNLDHGDMLILFTDGIEESKRKFRNARFEEIPCASAPDRELHGNHVGGQWAEELGYDRIKGIVDAVMNKGSYTLRKWHNGEGDKDLLFDFTSSEARVRDVIIALVAVEKMYRCYYDPKATADNRVLVDRIVDAFLQEHFLQYRDYCSFTLENPVNPAYMYYTHIMEDEQDDDLTIMGIRRK